MLCVGNICFKWLGCYIQVIFHRNLDFIQRIVLDDKHWILPSCSGAWEWLGGRLRREALLAEAATSSPPSSPGSSLHQVCVSDLIELFADTSVPQFQLPRLDTSAVLVGVLSIWFFLQVSNLPFQPVNCVITFWSVCGEKHFSAKLSVVRLVGTRSWQRQHW